MVDLGVFVLMGLVLLVVGVLVDGLFVVFGLLGLLVLLGVVGLLVVGGF